jgi:tetratricopeptide (TPR) repeat protein
MAPYEERYRLAALGRAGTLRLTVDGDFAVLRSEAAVRGLVPILLRRDGGLWRVDLVETFKNFFFDGSGVYVLWNARNPYAFAFDAARAPRRDDLSPLPLDGEGLEDALARLAHDDTAEGRLRRAELLFRNAWLVNEALPQYEEAARRAPTDARIVTTLADRASYLGMPDLAIPHVERLGPSGHARLAELHAQAGRPERAREYASRARSRSSAASPAR